MSMLSKNTITCARCREKRDLSDFNFKFKALGIRSDICKICQQKYYAANREKIIAKTEETKMQRIANAKNYVDHYLSERTCQDCGEYRNAYLTFDHVNGIKVDDISYMVAHGYSIQKITKELLKCEVVCYNCHNDREDARRDKKRIRKVPEPNTPQNAWYKDHADYPRWYLEQEQRPHDNPMGHEIELRKQLEDRYWEERKRLGR